MVQYTNKEKIVRDFCDKQDSYYKKAYQSEGKHNYLRRLRNSLIREAAENASQYDVVLDVGCGPAILYDELLSRCSRYLAVDLVQSNLDQIRKNNPDGKIECILSDIDEFNSKENYFDLIICSGSLEYTVDPVNNLKKLLMFLKPGGVLIASFPNLTCPYRLWGEYVYKHIWYIRRKLSGKPAYAYPRKLFLGNSLKKLCMNSEGIKSADVRYFGHKALIQPFDALFANLDYSITRFLEERSFIKQNWLASEFLLTVKK